MSSFRSLTACSLRLHSSLLIVRFEEDWRRAKMNSVAGVDWLGFALRQKGWWW